MKTQNHRSCIYLYFYLIYFIFNIRVHTEGKLINNFFWVFKEMISNFYDSFIVSK